ncbi:hypothetical protein F4679DRAFT_537673 [Xylaria curta]|nr:hypothetical protein F4679DRAFT_537673 [Xylaria curta]
MQAGELVVIVWLISLTYLFLKAAILWPRYAIRANYKKSQEHARNYRYAVHAKLPHTRAAVYLFGSGHARDIAVNSVRDHKCALVLTEPLSLINADSGRTTPSQSHLLPYGIIRVSVTHKLPVHYVVTPRRFYRHAQQMS